MLSLDSARWGSLRHAYGFATDTPKFLAQLSRFPKSDGQEEPWLWLWSSLAHEGDVYPASFAAVPHVVAALDKDPLSCDAAYFQFPAWVEICRVKKGVDIPEDLRESYFAAVAALPALAGRWAEKPWSDADLACAMGAVAAAKGHVAVAEAVLEIDDSNAEEVLQWLVEE